MTLPPPPPLQPLPDPRDTPCRKDPQLFDAFPVRHLKVWDVDPTAEDRIRAALHLCSQCPALVECRHYAQANPDIRGIVGGEYRPWITR